MNIKSLLDTPIDGVATEDKGPIILYFNPLNRPKRKEETAMDRFHKFLKEKNNGEC